MRVHAIIGDIQCPFECPKAVSVTLQVLEALHPYSLTLNGDIADCRTLSTRYPQRFGDRIIAEMREERERVCTRVKSLVKAANPKKKHWTDGNHEFRVLRAMMQSPATLQLMGVDVVKNALSIPSLFGLDDLGFEYAGEYPAGLWLDELLPPEQNVWIEHGYKSNKHAGSTAKNTQLERQCSIVVNHCERLALCWKKVIGNRRYFSVENGNLSLFDSPEGKNILTSYPFNSPDHLDKQQGFTVIYQDGADWFPVLVAIKNGRALWEGKLYRA